MSRFRRTFGGWMAALTACLLVPCAQGEHHEPKREKLADVARMEERWRTAQMADDVSSMDKLLSDQFLGITAAGQVVTKPQQLKRMRDRQLVIQRLDVSDTRIKISGNVAVVTSLANLEGTADGAPLRGAFRYTRVYQRLPGGEWKITNFEATRVPPADGRVRGWRGSADSRGGGASFAPASRAVSLFPLPPS